MLSRSDLYDPELVAGLTRRDIPGPPTTYPQRGLHRSRRRGASLEFSEHTEYAAGDDLRHLDWKVFAKSDRYFVKRYEDERLQRAVLLLDASGSMAYGAGAGGLQGSKYHLAGRIAVALAAVMLRQGDAVGLEVAGGAERVFLPPKVGMAHLEAIIEILGSVVPSGAAGLGDACRSVADRLRRSAAVFVISDLLDEDDEALDGPRELAARGLLPRLTHLLHADEVDLPFENTCRFLDLEGPASLVLDPLALRKAYREEMREFVQGVAHRAELASLPYAFLTSDRDPVPVLTRWVHRLGRD